jgi:hypothetical protein
VRVIHTYSSTPSPPPHPLLHTPSLSPAGNCSGPGSEPGSSQRCWPGTAYVCDTSVFFFEGGRGEKGEIELEGDMKVRASRTFQALGLASAAFTLAKKAAIAGKKKGSCGPHLRQLRWKILAYLAVWRVAAVVQQDHRVYALASLEPRPLHHQVPAKPGRGEKRFLNCVSGVQGGCSGLLWMIKMPSVHISLTDDGEWAAAARSPHNLVLQGPRQEDRVRHAPAPRVPHGLHGQTTHNE